MTCEHSKHDWIPVPRWVQNRASFKDGPGRRQSGYERLFCQGCRIVIDKPIKEKVA